MKLKMKIQKIKSIDEFELELPIGRGLYAITGQNGSGKSTVVTCASTVFFNIPMKDYFGTTEDDAKIEFELGNAWRAWKKIAGKWVKQTGGIMSLKGFYEGSIIFGNRFRNTSFNSLRRLDRVNMDLLRPAPEFIRENLGRILHNNSNFYERLLRLRGRDYRQTVQFDGDIFYYNKGSRRVSQFHMSTGENLLVSILNSINIRNSDRASLSKPCLLFLDEIELALHPSSLKRLVAFLQEMSKQYNYAIYFSTHSIELIGAIKPENIFFLERHSDNTLEVLNPCYPAYATRILYDHSGYDYVILVEDDLGKAIVSRILKRHSLLSNRLVHVLPCGGYANVIQLAKEVVNSNLVGKKASISIILDGDVKQDAQNYIAKHGIHNNIPVNYLPIESLEKYLKTNLHDRVDHKFFRTLNDFVFHQVSLTEIVDSYRNSPASENDSNGKKLYKLIDSELRERGKSRDEIIEMVVDYLWENKEKQVGSISTFLKKLLSN